jgi:hypothetical protein
MLTLFASVPGHGDDGVFYGTGGSVVPSQSRSVVMVAEEVVLDIADPRVVHGVCTFIFTNTGAPESLLVGFPDMSAAGTSVSDSLLSGPSIHDLKVTVDGHAVVTKLLPRAEARGVSRGQQTSWGRFDWVHTWPCYFDAGQTRVLRTEYRHPTSIVVSHPCIVHYILTTGASWSGPIGKAVVRVIPGALRLKSESSPRDWAWTGTEYVWTSEKFEPETDVDLSFQDPAQYAQCLIDNWRRLREPDPLRSPPGPYDVLEYCGDLGRPDFFKAVCAQLGDSLADLRVKIEEIYASDAYRSEWDR